VSRGQHTVVAAAIRQAFDQPDRAHAVETWRKVAEQLRPRWRKLPDLMDASEHDVWECPELCVSGPVHAVSVTQASKRSPNIMANWFRAANHSLTFRPSFSKLRMAR
jgi:hypothetical protein